MPKFGNGNGSDNLQKTKDQLYKTLNLAYRFLIFSIIELFNIIELFRRDFCIILGFFCIFWGANP
jgi:hypothetical protein